MNGRERQDPINLSEKLKKQSAITFTMSDEVGQFGNERCPFVGFRPKKDQ